ncbi:MAG: AsmA family protein [Usitatibacter sp.]
MTHWRKAVIGTVATLAFLLLGAAVALKVMVDPQRLEKVARDKAKQAWGRDLAVGDIQFELWPLPALWARDLKLEHPTEPAITAATVTAEFELLPLLIGKVRYRNLYLKDATVAWQGMPLRAEEAFIEADTDMRNVRISGSLWRNRRSVALQAQFDDLSRLGKPDAITTGQVELDFGQAQLSAKGRFPIDGTLRNPAVTVDAKGESLRPLFEFFGLDLRPPAPFTARFEVSARAGRVAFDKIDASLGRLKVKGDAEHTPGARPVTHTRLAFDHLDWARTSLDLGRPAVVPPEPPQMFRDTPLVWPLIVGLAGTSGTIDATFGTLVLRNGVVLKNLRMKAAYADDRFDIGSFATEMLGGTATGSILLEGRKKGVRLSFDGANLLLERWFKERGSVIPFTGGPLKVTTRLTASGNSMRELAASITGPFNARMGPGRLASERAGEAEAKMTKAFSGKESNEIQFECASFALPFKAGRATASPLVGARTNASSLITSGFIDMRAQELDLRGRLRGRSGAVGLAAIAGDVKITGAIRKPKMALDETATPKTIARGVAAIATLGLSALGTARADSEEARRNDPCEAVFVTTLPLSAEAR